MADLDSQSKWLKLTFFYSVIGFLLLLHTQFYWGVSGDKAGEVVSVLAYLFYTAAVVMLAVYIFVDEAKLMPLLIAFLIAALVAGVLVLVGVFMVRLSHYNTTKGFLCGSSALAAGVLAVMGLVKGG